MKEQFSLPLAGASEEPRVLYFDLETLRSAGEVGGWHNLQKMGMACAVCYDTRDGQYHVYGEDQVQDLLQHFRRADLIIGFNHVRFDYGVLAGYTDLNFRTLPSFDMLQDVERLLGFRLSLNSLAATTLGEKKSADGLQSLRWVKEGRLDLVREYCQRDVEVTRKLFEYGAKHGEIRYDKSGVTTSIPVRWDTKQIIASRSSS